MRKSGCRHWRGRRIVVDAQTCQNFREERYAIKDDTDIITLGQPETVIDPLTEIALDQGNLSWPHVLAKVLRTFRRKSSSQPARLSLIESEPLEVSLRTTSSARRRRTAMLPGPLSFRLRAASSRNETSSCQCRAFSMAQWARTASIRTSGVGIHDSAKKRVGAMARIS